MKILANENDMELMGIYSIKNIANGKVYIGSSTKIQRRYKNHSSRLRNNKHDNKSLQKDWNIFGEDNFIFDIELLIENEDNLPEIEKEYIEKYRSNNGVYNFSDPTEETIRIKLPKRDRGSNKGKKYKLSQTKVLAYLNDKFYDKIEKLHEHIGDRLFYIKSKLDEWFLNNIDDEDIKNDERLPGLLHKWYNKHGFNVVYFRYYKKEFRELGYNYDLNEDVLVLSETSAKLYRMKKGIKEFEVSTAFSKKRSAATNKKSDKKPIKLGYYKQVDILCERFEKEMELMQNRIKEKQFFNMEILDDYFLKKIEKEKIIDDNRVLKMIHSMYNKFGMCTLSVLAINKFKESLNRMGINPEEEKDIIIEKTTKDRLHV